MNYNGVLNFEFFKRRGLEKSFLLYFFSAPLCFIYLYGFGFQDIIEAEDGMQGLKMASKENVHLIFLDWEMPHLSGIQALNAIRSNESSHDIPVIMCTSESKKENILKALKAGVNSYFVKPFDTPTVQAKLEDLDLLKKKVAV